MCLLRGMVLRVPQGESHRSGGLPPHWPSLRHHPWPPPPGPSPPPPACRTPGEGVITWAPSVVTADHVAKTITTFPRYHITRTITPERPERDAREDSSWNPSRKARKRVPKNGWWYHAFMSASGQHKCCSPPLLMITILPSLGALDGWIDFFVPRGCRAWTRWMDG